jgi:hypothetical protein
LSLMLDLERVEQWDRLAVPSWDTGPAPSVHKGDAQGHRCLFASGGTECGKCLVQLAQVRTSRQPWPNIRTRPSGNCRDGVRYRKCLRPLVRRLLLRPRSRDRVEAVQGSSALGTGAHGGGGGIASVQLTLGRIFDSSSPSPQANRRRSTVRRCLSVASKQPHTSSTHHRC